MDILRENHKEFIKNNGLMLKSQQTFRCEKHDVFIEEVNKIALSANDNKRIQSIDSIISLFVPYSFVPNSVCVCVCVCVCVYVYVGGVE